MVGTITQNQFGYRCNTLYSFKLDRIFAECESLPTDNLEIFKKVIFHLPELKYTVLAYISAGIIYSIFTYLLISELLISAVNVFVIPLFAVLLFIMPGVAASEFYHFILPDYPRRWGYFLSLVNQLIVFLFTVLVSVSDNFTVAWQILWLGLTTLYINNFLVLLLSVGPDNIREISILSSIQPLAILGSFHFILGRFLEISLFAYISNLSVVFGAGIIILVVIYLTEFLVGSNVSNISMTSLATALLKNKREKLDLGRSVRPDVHTLEIENRSGLKRFAIPWIHPGPIEGFGGGQITSRIIKNLNSGRESGFFLHVPSNHSMDPADPEDSKKVLKALKESPKSDKASKLLKREFGAFELYGRRFKGKNIIYIDHRDFDDYDDSVFEGVIDKEETALIDLHNQPKGSRLGEMKYGTVEADKLRKGLSEFVKELEGADEHSYFAGFGVEMAEKPVSALVEKSDDQKTLLFGIEGNDASRDLIELREEFSSSFDEVLLFTTDTHASIHDLASNKQVRKNQVRDVVEQALNDISQAEIGLETDKADEMKLLKEDYYGLIFTINILVRLLPISLVVLYILLVMLIL